MTSPQQTTAAANTIIIFITDGIERDYSLMARIDNKIANGAGKRRTEINPT